MAMVLSNLGHNVFLTNTNKAKAIGLNGQKTDDKDAEVLSDLLRTNYLPKVHLKSILSREVKSILVQREFVVQSRVSMICHVRGILREYGIVIEPGVKNFYSQVGRKIELIQNELIKRNLSILVNHCVELKQEELRIDEEVIKFVKENHPEFYQKAEKLEKIPGIGWTTALLMVAIIDDPERFEDVQKFGAYLGLIPGQFSSADKIRMGSITRSGCEMLRRYLIHGARALIKYAMKKKDKSRIESWALKLVRKKGHNKAAVAVAHKLARVSFAVVRDGVEYEAHYKSANEVSPKQAA